jgi:PAS domain S-box-containing protein
VTTPATFHEAGDLDLYRSVFELNPQAMWICDSRISRFLLVNEAAIDQYGYSRNEFQSMKVNAVFSAESVDDFFSYGQRIRD